MAHPSSHWVHVELGFLRVVVAVESVDSSRSMPSSQWVHHFDPDSVVLDVAFDCRCRAIHSSRWLVYLDWQRTVLLAREQLDQPVVDYELVDTDPSCSRLARFLGYFQQRNRIEGCLSGIAVEAEAKN